VEKTLSNAYSPIQFLETVSSKLGVPIWVKREDQFQNHFLGGSKTRKLTKILPVAIAQGATDIITIGTTGSHHINATAIIGRSLGLDVHAILLPQPLLSYSKKLYHSSKKYLSGFITCKPYSCILSLRKLYNRLNKTGKKFFFIPPGGMNLQGIAAYIDAGMEVAKDIEVINASTKNPVLDYQICIYGTGGITTGLQLARQMQKTLPPILAVQVYPGFWNGKLYIKTLAYMSQRKLQLPYKNYCDKELLITANYIGEGYGTKDSRNIEAVRLFENDGIVLDPIYMARAGQALIDLTRKKKKLQGLLLWYTAPNQKV
jgi:D-cysteine desulfhydrase